jgi:hypothetical protein
MNKRNGIIWAFCIYTATITIASVWLLIALFPSPVGETTKWQFSPIWGISNDQGLVLLAMLAGIIGSILYAIQSFVVYIGNQSLALSWSIWYFARPWIGALLGMLIYFVLRAGLAAPSAASVTPYGVVAFGALAGLFSQKATQKLKEVFDTTFRTEEQLKDPLEGGAKSVRIASAHLQPVQASNDKTLTVKGENFIDGARVSLAGKTLRTQFVDNQTLEATIPAADLPASGQTAEIIVTNATPAPVPSSPFQFKF